MSPTGPRPKCRNCGCTAFRVKEVILRQTDYALTEDGYKIWSSEEQRLPHDKKNLCTCRNCGAPYNFDQVVGWVAECKGDKE